MAKKRPALSQSQQRRYWQIAKDKRLNGKQLMREVNCTYDQALYILQLGKDGKLDTDNLSEKRIEEAKELLEDKTFDELLEDEMETSLALLTLDKTMDPKVKIPLLQKIIQTRSALQKIRLENHMNVTDAGIVAGIVRRYEPDASNDRVLTIYHEEEAKWQAGIVY